MAVEPVRLVVWDLDETFWQGTLTEGGIRYQRDVHDLVIELCRRGIMSSICSKNDFERVKAVLVEQGIWDYFIFPSINWEPKGPRLQALVDTVQLRAPTIMFIDDNPMNLAEAKHFVPDLQVVDQTFIPQILGSPLFKGKNDAELKRLQQYKLLERRKTDETAAGSDNTEFLRSSGIRVTLDHDLEANIDRAVELINRTNQLNFTKLRLPEDPEAARTELRRILATFSVQAGLVRVQDRYGDYGYCGIYIMQSGGAELRLLHYCFSCRILNMGVESWLYQRLGRPRLTVVGEVLTDVVNDRRTIDWITAAGPGAEAAGAAEPRVLDGVVARGACDLHAVAHYFDIVAERVTREFNTVRDGAIIRLDHSMFARYGIEGLSAEALEAVRPLGYEPTDFDTVLVAPPNGARAVWLLSFWTDAVIPVYRHRQLGVTLPSAIAVPRNLAGRDLTQLSHEELKELDPAVREKVNHLRRNFRHDGVISEALFKENLRVILDRASPDTKVFILLPNDRRNVEGVERVLRSKVEFNTWTRQVAQDFPNVELLDIREFVRSEAEVQGLNHFDRMVYFRVYEHIMARVRAEGAGERADAAAYDAPALPLGNAAAGRPEGETGRLGLG
ncbi:MAG TPA: HAD-IIIC family phosphatase [Stellaceae bacterium]|nr:HAD-IIIC family phosphatase [Stellaceae bacterium]